LWEDISNYYGAVYLPFNYRDNLFTLRFQTDMPGSRAKMLSVVPELPGIEIRNEVLVSNENKKDAWIFGGPYSELLVVRGSLPPHQSALNVRGVLHDPASVFIAELKSELLKNNIEVKELLLQEGELCHWLSFQSPPLSEIVYHTNKVSVNLFAEALGELVGETKGVDAIKEQLVQMGFDISGMILEDVCGLPLKNAVPARLFTDLLVHIAQHPSDTFIASLPEGGKDGGVSGYCVAAPKLKGHLQAKTGSMSGVRCLSGYLTRHNGSRIAFTILVNHYSCSVPQLQKAIGKFLSSFL
jgi:D-alanyl-D-alanine carboxypeptidase/D-alanyl-D-alanine-endopeptidase (penicillin-binding protein 4)